MNTPKDNGYEELHIPRRQSKSPSPLSKARAWSLDSTSYYPHPVAYHGKNTDGHDRSADSSRRKAQQKTPGNSPRTPAPAAPKSARFKKTTTSSPSIHVPSGGSPASGVPETPGDFEYDDDPGDPADPADYADYDESHITTIPRKEDKINVELKVLLAVKNLAAQIKESKQFWATFLQKFNKEVAGIKDYAGNDIIQQLWRKKVGVANKFKDIENKEHGEFHIHQRKLKVCLNEAYEAAGELSKFRPQNDPSYHDSRQLALDKIRPATTIISLLTSKSAQNSAACADLVTELLNLEKLVSQRSPDAQVLYQLEQHEARKSPHEGETQAEPSIVGLDTVETTSTVQGTFYGELVPDVTDDNDGPPHRSGIII